MAQSTLDLILRTKKTGDGEQQAASGLTNLKSKFEAMTGVNLTAAAAIGAFTTALAFSVREAAEAERIQAQLGAVLKSTGGAAGLSADELNRLATELSYMSGVEDDAIVKAEALMLTFTKVGEEVFPGAMEAALNMSAVLGQDLQSSVIQLGKALNDPVVGATALRRVGVSLTEQQMDMIKTLVDANDTLGAQKLILEELNTEFGGAAEAMGDTFLGKIDKVKNSFGNLAETVGEKTLPVLGGLLDAIIDLNYKLTESETNSDKIKDAFDDGRITAEEYTAAFREMAATQSDTGPIVSALVGDLTDLDTKVKEAVENAGDFEDGHTRAASALTEIFTPALDDAATSAEDLAVSLEDELNKELKDLQLFISGPLGNEIDNFNERQGELEEKARKVAEEIGKLESKTYLTSAQKEELDRLKTEYGEITGAVEENKIKHDIATKSIIFNLLSQRAALDGLTSDEMSLLDNLALKWGLIDNATFEAVEGMDEALVGLANGEPMQLALARIGALKDDWDGLADKTINMTVNVGGPGANFVLPGSKPGSNVEAFADGGQFITRGPQLIMVGEAGPEQVTVQPLTNNNYNLTINEAGGIVNPAASFGLMQSLARST